ncbi:hypothetical protein DHW03_08535 [Pedobacter yonginense]|uniref:DUF4198 domain-containing protein n=1 Tax=Pedobacter yonginense TaxID=651869 RepID=A0A317ENZ2_9SPHI|nr:DUF4198 domain-containing protein [Pedobacter yonginense]PWS27623.1 hypothetical protein DHW03_08535 [Pedobacter yonginense]
MKTKLSLLFFFIAFSISNAFAHALWIETPSNGKKGQAQEVRIFFGEYESNQPDSTAKWFSNLKAFRLILTAPNGKTQLLKASPDVQFFKTSFTPDEDGTYQLSVVHEVEGIFENAKIDYYAFADVRVGNGKTNNNHPTKAALTIRPDKTALKSGDVAIYKMKYQKAPFAKQKLSIVGPDRKVQATETDADGKFTFKPEQQGNYFFEAFTEDKTPGQLNGKNYEKVWHLVTYTTEVK